MARRVYDFNAPLPPALYWDASFVVNFAHEAGLYHREAADFLLRLEQEKVMSFISTLTLDEAFFVLLRSSIEQDHAPLSFWKMYQQNPAVIAPYLSKLRALAKGLQIHPNVRILPVLTSFALPALEFMERYHLLPRDAYHLAIMNHYGIPHIVTMDGDFLVVPDLVIYTCVPNILAQE